MSNSISQTLNKLPKKMAQLDAELLLADSIGKNREFILAHPEFELSFWQALRFKFAVKKRLAGYSVATITGHKEFYGLDFFVNKHVLVPRPESELIVDEITHNVERVTHNDIFIDVGTGSGSLIISLVKLINAKCQMPCLTSRQANAKFIAIDISKQALKVAKRNAKLHDVDTQIEFFQGNLLTPLFKKLEIVFSLSFRLHSTPLRTGSAKRSACLPAGREESVSKKNMEYGSIHNSDIEKNSDHRSLGYARDDIKERGHSNINLVIIANLPYLTPDQIKSSPSIQKEPLLALDGGSDGLDLYRKLFTQIKTLCVTRYALCVYCEIDPSQTKAITELASENFSKATLEIKKDLAGQERLIIINF